MPLGLKTTIIGPAIAPNLALRRSVSDDIDDAAIAFGDRLLLRVDPRDIRRTADNPTGRRRVHYMAPNRDPAYWTGSGIAVGKVSGKYANQDVFTLSRTGTAAAGTHNDFACGPKSLNNLGAFSIFGVAHFDASMLGQAGLKPLIGLYRDKSAFETVLAHQYVSDVNYLTIWADQGDGGGENHNLDTSTVLAAGAPFAYLLRVTPGGTWSSYLHINGIGTELLHQTAAQVAETGSMQLFLGHATTDGGQWAGAHGRAYVVNADVLATEDDRTLSLALMTELMLYYGIA